MDHVAQSWGVEIKRNNYLKPPPSFGLDKNRNWLTSLPLKWMQENVKLGISHSTSVGP